MGTPIDVGPERGWIDGDAGFKGPTHYRGRMAARMEDWVARQDAIRRRARTLLEESSPPHQFLAAVSCCYPQEGELIDRYIDATTYCELEWWRLLGREEAATAPKPGPDGKVVTKDWPFWKKLKVRLKPLAETAKARGRISRLLRERIAAFNLARAEATQLLDTLSRLALTLAGADVDATRHVIRSERVQITLAPGGDEGHVRIKYPGTRKPRGPASATLRFVREGSPSHAQRVALAPDSVSSSFEPWSTNRSRYVVVAGSLDDIGAVNDRAFSALAESINLAIAIATLCGEAKTEDKAFATFDVTKSVVGIVESLPSGLIAMSPQLEREKLASQLLRGAESKVKSLRGLSTWLTRIDAGVKIYKGLTTLFSTESDLQYELRQGRPFHAQLQRFNGFANIVAGVAGVVEIAGAGLAASLRLDALLKVIA